MNSSVVRLAINLVRFMEVVAMLRALEQPELLLPAQGINSDNLKDKIIGGWELHITNDDFAALLTMAAALPPRHPYPLIPANRRDHQPRPLGKGQSAQLHAGRVHHPPMDGGRRACQHPQEHRQDMATPTMRLRSPPAWRA